MITGCQRSGTTLLDLILDSHAEIHGIDEMDFRDECLNEYLSESKYYPNVLFKLPTYAHAVNGIKALPGIKVLWCVRDPRDVVASMLNLRLHMDDSLVSWAAHPRGADGEIKNCADVLKGCMDDDLHAFLERYQRMRQVRPEQRSHNTKVFSAALCWRLKQELLKIYDSENINYKIVSYENIVTNPKQEIADVLSFLGLAWDDDVIRHDRLHKGMSVGNTDNERPIDNSSKGRWKKTLKSDDVGIISSICSGMAQKFGYKL